MVIEEVYVNENFCKDTSEIEYKWCCIMLCGLEIKNKLQTLLSRCVKTKMH